MKENLTEQLRYEGRVEGYETTIKEVIHRMVDKEYSLKEIAYVTDLSMQILKEMIKQLSTSPEASVNMISLAEQLRTAERMEADEKAMRQLLDRLMEENYDYKEMAGIALLLGQRMYSAEEIVELSDATLENLKEEVNEKFKKIAGEG